MRGIVSLLALVLAASAQAQVPASRDELPPMELGAIPSFDSEARAQRGCPGDIVVWADRDSGYFYPRSNKRYAATGNGTYTCLRQAMRADYWNINPFANNPERGREFPIDPSLLDAGS